MNRYLARTLEIDEAAISKALTRPVNWKIPNDYPAAQKSAEYRSRHGIRREPDFTIFLRIWPVRPRDKRCRK